MQEALGHTEMILNLPSITITAVKGSPVMFCGTLRDELTMLPTHGALMGR